MKKYYKDFYGACASTEEHENKTVTLKISVSGKRFYNKVLKSIRAARQVMSRFSDGTMEEVAR